MCIRDSFRADVTRRSSAVAITLPCRSFKAGYATCLSNWPIKKRRNIVIHLIRFGFLFVVFSTFFSLTLTVRAQVPPCVPSSNVTVIATGLNNPRGLKFGPDGQLYVAEGGLGGSLTTVGCRQVDPPIGPYSGDFNARIVRVLSLIHISEPTRLL